MAFVTVAGNDLNILVAGAVQDAGDQIGATKRSFSGAMRSSRRLEKRRWKFTVGPVSQTTHNALRTAMQATGGIVTCGGAALDNGSIACLVTLGPAAFVQDGSQSFLRTLEITLDEA